MALSLLSKPKSFSDAMNAVNKKAEETAKARAKASADAKKITLTNFNTDFSSLLQKDLGSYQAPSVGGGGGVDLSGIINNYNTAAQNKINAVKQSTSSSRQDLLTALQRFQESNKANIEQQREDYTSGRASLEDSAFMSNRQAQASAASRGLGGSGLQQLAQLQNRIAAGKEVSSLSKKNQTVQDTLRKTEQQQQEDYNTNLGKLSQNELASILNIQDETAGTINQLKYNENVRQKQAAASAAASAASYAQNYASQAQTYKQNYATGIQLLKDTQKSVENQLKNTTKTKDKKKIVANAINSLTSGEGNIVANYGLSDEYQNTAIKNLQALLKKYSK